SLNAFAWSVARRPTSRPSPLHAADSPSWRQTHLLAKVGLPAVARGLEYSRERRLERETGIEPATNSLEGCDSTTELLPLSSSLSGFGIRDSGLGSHESPSAESQITNPNPVAIAMVAREGFEPSKPLGRQIYSLLRLTASLPRRLSVMECVLVRHLPCGDVSSRRPFRKASVGAGGGI